MSHLDAWLPSLVRTLQLLIWTAIYFNKAASVSRGGGDNVCKEDPAAVQIRDIDLAPQLYGTVRLPEETAQGQSRDSAGLLAPCINNHSN